MTTADIIATIKDGKITSLKALQAFLNKVLLYRSVWFLCDIMHLELSEIILLSTYRILRLIS